MTSPTCQDSGLFREWAPLTALLQKIPAKIQTGLFTQDLSFTCIDAVAEFIAIGTNHGLVYWFNRKTEDLDTLACENSNSSITCVQVVSTVDYMVAAGNNQGVVTIFQIPKQLPDSLPECLKPKKKKQVERFNISGLHKAPVTAVKWSKNGMKLFSGDQNGLIVLTEMDFYLHLSKSTELLNEKYSVVQLSYQSGLLLISTLFRTIIVNRDQNNQVTQIGQRERKVLGKFGAVFSKNNNHIQEPIIYTSRPGLRIWQADRNGTVLKTLILKEAVKTSQIRVELLNPASDNVKKKHRADPSFGILLPFSDDLLVTYNEDVIYIINPTQIMIKSIVTDLRKVTCVTCLEDEIFILEGERNIIRIAGYPEMNNFNTDKTMDHLTPIAESNKRASWGLTELTSKLKSSHIMPAIPLHKANTTDLLHSSRIFPSVIIGTDTTTIINAEEAIEVPPIVPLKLDTHLVTRIDVAKTESNNCIDKQNKLIDRKDIFKKIGEQDFEEVVFTPHKKNKKLLDDQVSHASSINSKETTDNTDLHISIQQNKLNDVSIHLPSSHNSIQNIDNNLILDTDKNLETIEKAVQDKEKLLSNYLNLDLSKYTKKDQINIMNSHSSDSFEPSDYSWITDKQQCTTKLESIEEDLKKHKNKLIKLPNSIQCSPNDLEKENRDDKPWNVESDLEDRKILETHFNALSKEFVTAAIYQENEDWILLG